ncbi:MAG: RDD family protein [Chloroflexota bacterium]|nr:RDD family protein [Chloroflexota bacterium]
MAQQPGDDEPRGWDLEWAPVSGTGVPQRWPPSAAAAYAEFPLRAAAFALDAVIVTMLMQLVSQAVGLSIFWFTRGDPQAGEAVAIVASGTVFGAGLLLTATSVYFWRVFRATPGQMLFGLFVVRRSSGEVLSPRSVFVRWLLLYAPLGVVVSYSSVVTFLFGADLLRTVDPLLVTSTALGLPLVWYAFLAVSTLAERRRGRGLHDRICASVVVRRAGPPA